MSKQRGQDGRFGVALLLAGALRIALCLLASCGGSQAAPGRHAAEERWGDWDDYVPPLDCSPGVSPPRPDERPGDLAIVERARELLVAFGPEVRLQNRYGFSESFWFARDGQAAVLCVRALEPDVAPGTLCFQGVSEPPRFVELVPIDEEDPSRGDFLCIDDHVLTWPAGEPRAGSFEEGIRREPPSVPFPFTRVPVPPELPPSLGRVTIRTMRDPRAVMIQGRLTSLLCLREAGRIDCAVHHYDRARPRWIDAHISERDANGSRWMAWVRERLAGGGCPTSEEIADLSVILVRQDASTMRVHGTLPLGGWMEDGRVARSEDTIIPLPSELARLDTQGCLEVVARPEYPLVDCHGQPRLAARPRRPPERAPEHLDGRDAEGAAATSLDLSGAWMPLPEGGFRRVHTCPE
jgi:hypothetical protein